MPQMICGSYWSFEKVHRVYTYPSYHYIANYHESYKPFQLRTITFHISFFGIPGQFRIPRSTVTIYPETQNSPYVENNPCNLTESRLFFSVMSDDYFCSIFPCVHQCVVSSALFVRTDTFSLASSRIPPHGGNVISRLLLNCSMHLTIFYSQNHSV